MKKQIIFVSVFLLAALAASAQESIPSISSDSLINAISDNILAISKHTDSWEKDNRLITFLAVTASVFSIIAGIAAGAIWFQRYTSKKTQLAIIDDLTRHFIKNAMCIEKVDTDVTPSEIIFRRCAVLPDDLNLNRFTVKTKDYAFVHRIELSTRNYNIHAEWLAENYDKLSPEKKQYFKTELLNRGGHIATSLNQFRLRIFTFHHYLESEEEKCSRKLNLIELNKYRYQAVEEWKSMSSDEKLARIYADHESRLKS